MRKDGVGTEEGGADFLLLGSHDTMRERELNEKSGGKKEGMLQREREAKEVERINFGQIIRERERKGRSSDYDRRGRVKHDAEKRKEIFQLKKRR